MAVKNVEIIRLSRNSVRGPEYVRVMKDTGPYFGQVKAGMPCGGISFDHMAFSVENPFISNWGSSIFADIEFLRTPAGRILQDYYTRSGGSNFGDIFLISPYSISKDDFLLAGFYITNRK